jgi:hypothetical protein
MWELNEIVRKLKEEGRTHVKEYEIFEARERMHKIVENAKKEKNDKNKAKKSARKKESAKKINERRNNVEKEHFPKATEPMVKQPSIHDKNIEAFDDIVVFGEED